MGSWNAVMEVMRRAAGDTHNTEFPKWFTKEETDVLCSVYRAS
jgi:hypothetical protein